MKTFLVVLALAALVALSAARPQRGPPGGPRRGPGGPGHGGPRGGPRGGAGAILKRACRIEFQDGSIETKDCFKANGLFDCQKIELSDFPRIPRKWENATEISLCLPVPCTEDSECSGIDARSKCVVGLPKPDNETREEFKRLRDTCHPRRQRPTGAREDEDDLVNEENDDQPPRARGRRPRPDANDDDEDEQSPRSQGHRPRPDGDDDDDDEVEQSPRASGRRPRPDAIDNDEDEQSPRLQRRRPRLDGDDDDEQSPRQRGRRPRQDDNDDVETDADEQLPEPFLQGRKMCSIPPSYIIANKACRVEAGDGSVIRSRECRSRGNQTVACNATSACDVPYQGNDVKLYFCERPKRPQGGNGPFGGNRQSGQQDEEGRPRGRGNTQGRPGNRPRGGNAPQDGEGQTPENEQTVEEP